ncbi:unnamed protein product [Caenorhabditis bovis]|uniref:RanBD1 domain-containing protein n=1 Tax=Caenorhabditis bovis TaxID=2654633 RepID=A0A8S1EU33_9PELO|nr:unnamed protein product [Caenorhabditis bovis]
MERSPTPLTSEEHMNQFRFRDKMTLLNSEFLSVLQHFFKEKSHYDFSSTMTSYMEHVKKLKVLYKLEVEDTNVSQRTEEKRSSSKKSSEVQEKPRSSQRKIAKAVRKNKHLENCGNNLSATPAPAGTASKIFSSSPAIKATPAFPKFGDISAISKETPPPIKDKAPEVPAPTTARKRAIRGGGPLGGSESVIFKGGNDGKSSENTAMSIPVPTIKLPAPSKDFWSKKSDKPENNGGSLFGFLGKTETPPFTGFSFGNKNTEQEKDEEKKENPPPKQFVASPTNEKSSTSSPLSFGAKTSENKDEGQPKSSLFTFGSKPSESVDGGSKKALFTFSGQDVQKNDNNGSKPTLSFPSFGSLKKPDEEKKDNENSKSTTLSFPKIEEKKDYASTSSTKPSLFSFGSSSSNSLFGKSAPAASNGLSFGSGGSLFSNLAQKAEENAAKKEGEDDGEEEAEYVPPKAEVTEIAEPDAILSTKVSVFKFSGKEYSKLGVGMLYIKKVGDKHSVLIRAATTTGTVWLNCLCNPAMKATKVDDPKKDKLRLTCPATPSEMVTMLLRFGTPENADMYFEKISEITK